MDSFELKKLLLDTGFTEYWHPGKYDKNKVKALGFEHPKYGVVYLKHDPKKPNIPQTFFPLVINGGYEQQIKNLGENSGILTWSQEHPAYYNTNLRGFPSRVNPEYNGGKNNPQLTAYGIDFNVANKKGLKKLFTWLESPDVSIDFNGRKSSSDAKDHDERVLREIKTRRGQPEFRQRLLTLFKGKCCVTGCSVESVLEAAHITPHAEGTNYSDDNGLLLRSDIHTLFDLHLLSADENGIVHIHNSLKNSEYENFNNKKIVENLSESMAMNLKDRFANYTNKNNGALS